MWIRTLLEKLESSSNSQEVGCIFWTLRVCYHAHNSPQFILTLSQTIPVHTLPPNLRNHMFYRVYFSFDLLKHLVHLINALNNAKYMIHVCAITVKPFLIRGPQDAVTLAGGSVEFQCRVGGDPIPDVLWRRTAGGGNMPLGRVHILEDRSLRVEAVIPEDEGEYSCEADNDVGTVTASATLIVHCKYIQLCNQQFCWYRHRFSHVNCPL